MHKTIDSFHLIVSAPYVALRYVSLYIPEAVVESSVLCRGKLALWSLALQTLKEFRMLCLFETTLVTDSQTPPKRVFSALIS